MLQIEVEPNNVANSVYVSESHEMTCSQGYVNNAFEEGPRKADKVNDEHNVHIKYTYRKKALITSCFKF